MVPQIMMVKMPVVKMSFPHFIQSAYSGSLGGIRAWMSVSGAAAKIGSINMHSMLASNANINGISSHSNSTALLHKCQEVY